MCINCYEIVPAYEVYEHSQNCVDVSQSVKKLDQQTYIEQIEFKITKLISSLQRNQNQKILDFALHILQEDYFEISCSKNLKSIIDQLQLLKKENTTQELMYLERLIVLTREKMKESLVYKANEEQKLQIEISVKKEELDRLSQEVKLFKNRTEKIGMLSPRNKNKVKKSNRLSNQNQEYFSEFSDKKQSLHMEHFQMIPYQQELLEDVNSVISAEGVKPQVSISAVSIQSEQDNFLDLNFTQNIQVNQNEDAQQIESAQQEEILRYFYGLCLNQKLKYKSKDLAQYVQISQLYEKVKQDNIPSSEWNQFIKNELENADRWVDQRQLKSGIIKQAFLMETIIEEDEN